MYTQHNNPFLKKGDVKRTIGRGKNFNKANDTGTGAAAAPVLRTGARRDAARKSHATPLHATRLQAVSYTHLRAHETKANLVCRLLLEKKN